MVSGNAFVLRIDESQVVGVERMRVRKTERHGEYVHQCLHFVSTFAAAN